MVGSLCVNLRLPFRDSEAGANPDEKILVSARYLESPAKKHYKILM
jgi:hypothetical protein